MALAFWMLHTVDIHLCELHELLSSYARLSQRAIHHGWDAPLQYVDPRLLFKISEVVSILLKNEPSPLPEEPTEPATDVDEYEIVVTTDASALGWAAIVVVVATGQCILLQGSWRRSTGERWDLSTVAEPAAAAMALGWIQEHLPMARRTEQRPYPVALITDHAAIVTGQPRWWNHHGGFSGNIYLNNLFRKMLHMGVQAWHIPGELNVADGPSRAPPNTGGSSIAATEVHGLRAVPVPLSALAHPFVGCSGFGAVVDERRMFG